MGSGPPHLQLQRMVRSDGTRREYEATQEPLGRRVVAVGLAAGAMPSSPGARSLRAEAEVLAQLDHPNIARLLDFIEDEQEVWLVLEDLPGYLLEELAPRRLAWHAVAAVGLDLCRALVHAHELGITHGGLEARSVVVTTSGRTKLCGFGQRGVSDSHSNEPLEVVAHRSLTPETSLGQAHTPLSDLFALGAVLSEALTGQSPFGAPDSVQYANQVRNFEPPPIERHAPDVPRALSGLVERMLSKLPANRPPSALSVAAELEALVGGATVPTVRKELIRLGLSDKRELPPVPLAQTTKRSSFRTSTWLLALAALGLLATGAVVGALFRERKEQPSPPPTVVATSRGTSNFLHLRVVAHPWAHVFVDGQQLETTPFAHPIPLEPGSHLVRLEHPHAPPEERTVEGRAGQVVLLDVQMHVVRPLSLPIAPAEIEESTP